MKIVATAAEIPPDAPRADLQLDGNWLVYEPGDALPPPPQSPPEAGPLLRAMLPERVTPEELTAIASSDDGRVRSWMLRLSLLPADTDLRTLPGVCDELQHMIDVGLLDESHRTALLA